MLSSEKEVIAYISSPTGFKGFEYSSPVQIRLADRPFPDGLYTADSFDPKKGPAGSRQVRKREGLSFPNDPVRVRIIKPHDRAVAERTYEVTDGRVEVTLPSFLDDVAVHIQPME